MKYNIIDILIDSELFDDVHIFNNYSEIPESHFFELLEEYSRKSNAHLQESAVEYLQFQSPLNIYLPERLHTDYFTKALLSMDSVVIDDEIIDALVYLQDFDISNQIIKSSKNPINHAKSMTSSFIKYIKKNQPLISNGTIQVIPSYSKKYESSKKRALLINDSNENSLFDIIPKNTINIYKKSIKATPIQRVHQDGDKIFFKELKKREIAGELSIRIEDCNSKYVNGYIYCTAKTYIDENGNQKIDNSTRVNSIPKSRYSYDNWVAGTINRTIREHFINLNLNLTQAHEINSSLGYDCFFTNKILNNINKEGNINRKMIEINTPFLNGVSSEIIAKIKNDYGDSFSSYKKVLRETARKLQLTKDRNHINIINNEFRERIYDEGIKDVQLALADLRKTALNELVIESGIASIGFIDSSLTIYSLISAGLGMTRTLKSIKDKHDNVKSHPSYFLLKTLHK